MFLKEYWHPTVVGILFKLDTFLSCVSFFYLFYFASVFPVKVKTYVITQWLVLKQQR